MTRPGPERITALGGGTGLPAVLSGLRGLVANGRLSTVTAVVAMTDDGGSSGRLRKARGTLPPGDVRNCLVALAAERDLMAGLFQHRYGGSEELGGHTVGNLILVALAEQSGSFLKAVELSGRVLRTAGRILPVTLEDVVLEATLEDGSRVEGETRIGRCEKRVKRISLRPESPRPTPGVVEAIEDADLIVLGPGSLYTSVAPHLAVPEVADALKSTQALRVLVANLVSEKGESAGLGLADHVEIIEAQAGGPIVDAVVVNRSAIDARTLGRYEAEGTYPLTWPDRGYRDVQVIRRDLLAKGPKLRHDPTATVEGLMAAWRSARAPGSRGAPRGRDRGRRGRSMSRRSERNADSGEEILTSYEARSLLKIGRTKLWELTRKNLIPAYRVGRSKTSALRYKRSELLAWLDANRVQNPFEKP